MTTQDIKLFVAVKAFIRNSKGDILLLRESNKYEDGTNSGKYDIVGGRIEPGERFDDSLMREIKEETGLDVKILKPFYVNEWRPEVRGEKWQVVATFFECVAENENVILSEDHDSYIWINPSEYMNYNIIDNLKEAFEAYLSR